MENANRDTNDKIGSYIKKTVALILPHTVYQKKKAASTKIKIKKKKSPTGLPVNLRNLKEVRFQTSKLRLDEYFTLIPNEPLVAWY